MSAADEAGIEAAAKAITDMPSSAGSHPRTVARVAVDAAMPVIGKMIAEDIFFWAKAMSTQKAQTAAMFAADRVCEAFGIDADEVAREAHAKWLHARAAAVAPRETKELTDD